MSPLAAAPLVLVVLVPLVLLPLAAAAAAAAPPPPQCATIGGAGTCYVGRALQRLDELDAAACCAACAADPTKACGAWELRADQGSICVLKAPGPPRPSGGPSGNCSASGTVGPAPSPAPSPGPSPGPPPPPASGQLAFDRMFVGGAVLQMGPAMAAVWGWNAPNTAITLTLDGAVVARAAPTGGRDGNFTWRAMLPPQPQGYSRVLQVTSGGQTASVNVSFGVVILCSGQSNMGMAVGPGKFVADNGTAESAASARYAGKIFLRADSGHYGDPPGPGDPGQAARQATGPRPRGTWFAPSNTTLPDFSAVCWYSGRSLYDRALAASGTPLGLIVAAVGGSPIEYWLPPMPGASPPGYFQNPCEDDYPQCDNGKNDTEFYREYIEKLVPYTLGAVSHHDIAVIWLAFFSRCQRYRCWQVIWDQAERDVKCPVAMQAYPCMQQYLISSVRPSSSSSYRSTTSLSCTLTSPFPPLRPQASIVDMPGCLCRSGAASSTRASPSLASSSP